MILLDARDVPPDLAEYFEPAEQDNLSDSWYIVTESSRLAHYAGWPGKLARRLIQCSTPDAGCCRDCGVSWSEVVERETLRQRADAAGTIRQRPKASGYVEATGFAQGAHATSGLSQSNNHGGMPTSGTSNVLGWLPSCDCNPLPSAPLSVAEARKLTRAALVVDCFGGTGVTAREARAMGRSAVSIDPILEYCQMARDNAGEGCIVARQERPRRMATITGDLFPETP